MFNIVVENHFLEFKTRTMKLLEGKTVLVTGASKGIGKAVAEKCAQAGANIAFTYLSSVEKGQALEEELKAFGVKAKGYR